MLSETREDSIDGVTEDTTKQVHGKGGWWAISKAEELVGPIAIEFGWQTYIKSVDNGLITIGLPHNENDPPSAEEIFTAIRIEDKLAIKSGYDKFIKVGPKNELVGTSDAVGTPELFELVFQVTYSSRITTFQFQESLTSTPGQQ